MKKIFLVFLTTLILVGCGDEKLNERSVVNDGKKQIESTELDKWILDNITKPYGRKMQVQREHLSIHQR